MILLFFYLETEDGTRHKIADKQEEDLLVANAGNAEKLPEQDPTSDSVQESSEQQLEEEVDQPAGEIDNAEAEEPEPDTSKFLRIKRLTNSSLILIAYISLLLL